MRRRSEAARFRPVLNSAEVAVTASIEDVSGSPDCKDLLVRVPEYWRFIGVDDPRFEGTIETVAVKRRHPDGIPAGDYLKLPVDTVIDPWGRVSVGLEFDTPNGYQRAELTIQTRDEETENGLTEPQAIGSDGLRLDAKSVLDFSKKSSVFFVEGRVGDVLDLTDDKTGRWSMGDSDGTHRLYMRYDRSGKRSTTLAVRNGIEVKLS